MGNGRHVRDARDLDAERIQHRDVEVTERRVLLARDVAARVELPAAAAAEFSNRSGRGLERRKGRCTSIPRF